MTALMERPDAAFDVAIPNAELSDVRRQLEEQRVLLIEQARILGALDARREQVDDLVSDMLPVMNEALLLAVRTFENLESGGVTTWWTETRNDLATVARAPAPRWRTLLAHVRQPQARRGLALLLTALTALGRLPTTNHDRPAAPAR